MTAVQFEPADRIAVVTINRPNQLNAIDRSVLQQLDDGLSRIESDATIRAFVVAGAGRAFCAGADIAELSSLADGAAFREWIREFTDVLDRLDRCPKPALPPSTASRSAAASRSSSPATCVSRRPTRASVCPR
jgi:enoyl-CoA hydratase